MKTCKVDGCKGKYKAKGYCGKHYQKHKTYIECNGWEILEGIECEKVTEHIRD